MGKLGFNDNNNSNNNNPLTIFAALGGLRSSKSGFAPGWDYFSLTLISKI